MAGLSGVERPGGEPALERGDAIDESQPIVAEFPRIGADGSANKRSKPSVMRAHGPGRRGALAARSGAATARRRGRATARARRCTRASAATSARPRLRPCPASGWTTWAASPTSTQPGPHQALGARRRRAARRRAREPRRSAPTSAPAASPRPCSNAAGASASSAVGALGRQRPDQRVRALGLGAVERQQREHVGRAEPLARDVAMRLRRDQPRRDRASGRSRCARSRRRARRSARPRRGLRNARSSVAATSAVDRASRAARSARAVVERVLERGGIGDDGELADALLPGRELELARGGSPRTSMSWTGVVAPAPRLSQTLSALQQRRPRRR